MRSRCAHSLAHCVCARARSLARHSRSVVYHHLRAKAVNVLSDILLRISFLFFFLSAFSSSVDCRTEIFIWSASTRWRRLNYLSLFRVHREWHGYLHYKLRQAGSVHKKPIMIIALCINAVQRSTVCSINEHDKIVMAAAAALCMAIGYNLFYAFELMVMVFYPVSEHKSHKNQVTQMHSSLALSLAHSMIIERFRCVRFHQRIASCCSPHQMNQWQPLTHMTRARAIVFCFSLRFWLFSFCQPRCCGLHFDTDFSFCVLCCSNGALLFWLFSTTTFSNWARHLAHKMHIRRNTRRAIAQIPRTHTPPT